MKSFLPQDAYYKATLCNDIYKGKYNILIDDKIIYHSFMESQNLPVPERFFIYQFGRFYKDSEIIDSVIVDKIISEIDDDRIYVKKFTGGGASGVSVFTRNNNNQLVNERGDILTSSFIIKEFKSDRYIFEKLIKQSTPLSLFNPDTVNTIRVLTNGLKVVSANVRMGRKGSFVDNAAKGGLIVSLDIDTGYLGEYAMRKFDSNKYYVHPDSKLPFKNTYVNQWFEVKRMVETALLKLPFFPSVGFDIATTDNGPVIIEINTGAGVYASQMGRNYGIAEYFYDESGNVVKNV